MISSAQFDDSPFDLEHPAVAYGTRPTATVVDALGARLQSGEVSLPFETIAGHLKPVLDALDVRVDSQVVVFSKTSLQSNQIRPGNPRAIYFNDAVMVGWVRGGFIEIAAQDPQQGAVFYRVLQAPTGPTAIFRDNRCLQCHNWYATLGVPGFLAKSVASAIDGSGLPWLANGLTDHRSPIAERWAGWFVTGAGLGRHMGNAPIADRNVDEVRVEDANVNLASLRSRFDTTGYLSPHSDAVALLVFNHQLRMMNLLTRIGWEARALAHEGRSQAAIASALRSTAAEVVDYMLFVDEAPLDRRTRHVGVCGIISGAWPAGQQGPLAARSGSATASLHVSVQLHDLFGRVRPAPGCGQECRVCAAVGRVVRHGARAEVLAALTADRGQIIEILRETKKDLPASFTPRPSRP